MTRTTRQCWAWLIVGAALATFAAAPARAAFVAEYFDNYGTGSLDRIYGLSGGHGWLSDWTGPNSQYDVGYDAGVSTSFSNPNYTGGGQNDSNDGRGRLVSSDQSSMIIRRSFDQNLTGTIWMSALVRHASNTTGDVLFWFRTTASGSGANTFVGLRNGDVPTLRHDSETVTAADLNSAGENLLLLTRIVINDSGNNDRVDFWVKTEGDDLSSVAALGAPLLTSDAGDVFGDYLSFIGLSGSGANANIDNLRYADGGDAFAFVLGGEAAVPTPAALPAGLGLLSLISLRRRRRRA